MLKILRQGDYPAYLCGLNIITRVFLRGGKRLKPGEKMTMPVEAGTVSFKDGGKGHKPRNTGSL